MRNQRLIPTLLSVTMLLAACSSNGTTTATETRTTTVTATVTPTAEPAAPQSKLIDLELPAGSTNESGANTPEVELWTVPLTRTELTDYLNQNLPINKPAKGIPWCSKGNKAHWDWSDGTNWIAVDIMSDGKLAITRGDNELGRDTCDNP